MAKQRHIDADATALAKRGPFWTSLAIVGLTFAVFLPAYAYDYERHEGFVWDDDDHFLNDPLIRSDDGWWRIWLDPQPGIVGSSGAAVVWNYWPLTRTSFWLERRVWGTDADGMPSLFAAHVTNVALHAMNAVLLLVVLRQLRLPGAELAALLFALHPVTVESVAWITQRKAVLSTFFFLIALAGWFRFTSSERARWYAFTCISFLFALMAKTTTVMLPVVLVLVHWYQREPWTTRAVLRLAPLFAMSMIAGVTSIVFERFIGSTGTDWSASLAERFAAAGMIAWFYLGKLVLPLDLAFNYPRWPIDAASPFAYLPTLAIVAVALVLWRYRESWARATLLGLACFLVNLFPVLGFFNVYGMRYAYVADHWQYLACLSVLALVGGILSSTPRWIAAAKPALAAAARIGVAAVSVLALASFAWLSWHQSGHYVDRITLWRHTLEREPASLIANNNVGTHLLDERRYAEAIAHFRRVSEADPSLPEPFVNLGNAFDASGDRAQAALHWERALERDPRQSVALLNLAASRMNDGRLEEAEALLQRALEAQPRFAPALERLARLYRRQGRPEAIEPFVMKATQPPTADRLAGGRRVARGIWSAMAVALVACGLIVAVEARRPDPGPRATTRTRTT